MDILEESVFSYVLCGGLGIGSLYASNHAMLVKWHWRFYREKNAPWRRLITSIHGTHGGLDQGYPFNSIRPSTSKTIIGLNKSMLDLHIDLGSIDSRKMSWISWKKVCSPMDTTTIALFPGDMSGLSPATCRWGKPRHVAREKGYCCSVSRYVVVFSIPKCMKDANE
ncbi:hypothetical protein Tco_1035223 [Tanacetum coccineum]